MRVLHLVDDLDYVRSNCFQHQLSSALHGLPDRTIITKSLFDLLWGRVHERYDLVLSCLKQRTLAKDADRIARVVDRSVPFHIYDQDPWESFKAASPHKGSYQRIRAEIPNARFFVTTPWWVEYLVRKGIDATFVHMWMLPEYCTSDPPWHTRSVPVAFYGTLHPRRQVLVRRLEAGGVPVKLGKSNGYGSFLTMLSDTQVFVHDEYDTMELEGGDWANMGMGMWVKDVEAAARGCWSVRNRMDAGRYLDGVETVRFYDHVDEAAGVVKQILEMDPVSRQGACDRTVAYIRSTNKWQETARALVGV
jgi:hypothetical protein